MTLLKGQQAGLVKRKEEEKNLRAQERKLVEQEKRKKKVHTLYTHSHIYSHIHSHTH
jgi:hypothetical protein